MYDAGLKKLRVQDESMIGIHNNTTDKQPLLMSQTFVVQSASDM